MTAETVELEISQEKLNDIICAELAEVRAMVEAQQSDKQELVEYIVELQDAVIELRSQLDEIKGSNAVANQFVSEGGIILQ